MFSLPPTEPAPTSDALTAAKATQPMTSLAVVVTNLSEPLEPRNSAATKWVNITPPNEDRPP